MFTRRSTGLDGEQHATGFHAPFSQNDLRLLLLFIYLFLLFVIFLSHLLPREKYWYVTTRLTKLFTFFLNKSAIVT